MKNIKKSLWYHKKNALGVWNVTSLAWKEPELVCEVEQHLQDTVGLWNHTPGEGWILSYSVVDQGERRRAGRGIFTSPQMSASVLEFSPVRERGLPLCGLLHCRREDSDYCSCVCTE